jgi:hypothetical protein
MIHLCQPMMMYVAVRMYVSMRLQAAITGFRPPAYRFVLLQGLCESNTTSANNAAKIERGPSVGPSHCISRR